MLVSGNLTFSQTILCPENKEIDALVDKAITLSKVEGGSKTAIINLQKGIALSKSAGCLKGEMVCNKNLMLLYSKLSEYNKALEISKEVEKLALELKDYKSLSTLYLTKATLYNYLGLYNESIKEYEVAIKYAELIENDDRRHYELGYIYYNMAPYYQDTSLVKSEEYLKESKSEIEKIKNNSSEISLNQKKDMLISINMNLGTLYKTEKNPKKNIPLSEAYFKEALKEVENDDNEIDIDTKIDLFEAVLEFYYGKKEYNTAISYGEKMLELEKSYSSPYNRRVAYMSLAKSYSGIGKNEISQNYLDLFSKLNDSINIIEKEAVEEPVRQIISKNNKNYSEKLSTTILISGTLVLLVIITGLVIWKKRKRALHAKYETVINHLKNKIPDSPSLIESETEEKIEEAETTKTKQVNIADETITSLLKKLDKFESSNKFTRQDINFSYLVNYLGTNSKYLSEILKQHKEKSFSQYINDLRIDYIIKLLYQEPKYREYKISYLAEECGFSSRSFFAKTFKEKTGSSPSYFIENLRSSSEKAHKP